MSDPETLKASPPRRGRALLRAGFVLAVAVAVAVFLWERRHDVGRSLEQLSGVDIVVSLLLGVAGAWLPGVVWADLLTGQGDEAVGVLARWRAFFVAQLGKYLPGGVWSLVAQVTMARDLKVSGRKAATATFLTIALSIISAVLTAGIALPFALPSLVGTYWWVFAVIPLLLALLHPRVVEWWSATAFRLLRRPGAGVRLTWRVLIRSTVLLVLSWGALGLHFGVLVHALGGSDGGVTRWVLSLGVFGLAWVAGFLVVIAPAGAGVREAALVLGFAAVLPAATVLAIALVSRVLLVVADVLLAGGAALAGARARPDRPPVTGTPG